MIRHPVASHAIELCFSALPADLWLELFSMIFQTRIAALSAHQFATFPLQAFIAACPQQQHLDSIFSELEPAFGQLLQTRPTVITSLLLACARLQHKQPQALALLRSAAGATSTKALVPLLLNISEPQRCALVSALLSLHGDASRDVREAVDALDAAFLLSLCPSSAASKVVCAMLAAPALHQKHKDAIVEKLLPHTASLACTSRPSFTVFP
jgi:hypothetical protein